MSYLEPWLRMPKAHWPRRNDLRNFTCRRCRLLSNNNKIKPSPSFPTDSKGDGMSNLCHMSVLDLNNNNLGAPLLCCHLPTLRSRTPNGFPCAVVACIECTDRAKVVWLVPQSGSHATFMQMHINCASTLLCLIAGCALGWEYFL